MFVIFRFRSAAVCLLIAPASAPPMSGIDTNQTHSCTGTNRERLLKYVRQRRVRYGDAACGRANHAEHPRLTAPYAPASAGSDRAQTCAALCRRPEWRRRAVRRCGGGTKRNEGAAHCTRSAARSLCTIRSIPRAHSRAQSTRNSRTHSWSGREVSLD